MIGIFKQHDAKPEDIADAETRFLVGLYRDDMDEETLEEVRYQPFAKSTTKSKFNLASLPPTNDAARYHAFRTYHQIQKWYGIKKKQKTGAGNVAPMGLFQ